MELNTPTQPTTVSESSVSTVKSESPVRSSSRRSTSPRKRLSQRQRFSKRQSQIRRLNKNIKNASLKGDANKVAQLTAKLNKAKRAQSILRKKMAAKRRTSNTSRTSKTSRTSNASSKKTASTSSSGGAATDTTVQKRQVATLRTKQIKNLEVSKAKRQERNKELSLKIKGLHAELKRLSPKSALYKAKKTELDGLNNKLRQFRVDQAARNVKIARIQKKMAKSEASPKSSSKRSSKKSSKKSSKGGFYVKYMKYKTKYLELKAQGF